MLNDDFSFQLDACDIDLLLCFFLISTQTKGVECGRINLSILILR